jgi:hypothetical protein
VNDDFDLSGVPHTFDFSIAAFVIRRLSLNAVARCFASVIRKLSPGGRFYVSWPDVPGEGAFAPAQWADGSTTWPDREPYHYSFEMLAGIVALTGGTAERVDDDSHPRGERLMVVTRRP